MSGIAGVLFFDGRSAARPDLERMGEVIAHRGRDASGVWCDGPVGFAHRMLWTTPESLTEKLPLAKANLAITSDARIDNREELRAALDFSGRPATEIPDSELILASYQRWAERCVEKLLGEFAFAIWDGRRQLLFCARDHMGVKPFYYHRGHDGFFFGSEIKALLSWPEAPRRLNEVRVADYLCSMLEDKEITFYEEILRLPPAHTLTVSREQLQLQRYWQLDAGRDIRMNSDAEYAEAFRSIFTEAVRCRLRSAFPVGSMLSGGLDSSSIVCVARNALAYQGRSKLITFSATFDDVPQCDEQPFIRAVLAGGGVEPYFVRADHISPLVEWDHRHELEDGPLVAANLYIHWGVFAAAREKKVRVLLDGFEGDAVVSLGIERLAELARSGQWRALAGEISRLARDFHRPALSLWWKHAIRPLAPRPARSAWLGLREIVRPFWDHDAILRRDFARRIGIPTRFRTIAPHFEARSARESHLRRLESGAMPALRESADNVAAAFQLELRYPFADRRLVEFCLALPSNQKLRQGWTRWILRQAMDGVLPREVQWRPGKSDLSSNFNHGLRAFERESLEAALFRDPRVIERFVEIGRLRMVHQRFVSMGDDRCSMALWKSANLASWLRRTGPGTPTPGSGIHTRQRPEKVQQAA